MQTTPKLPCFGEYQLVLLKEGNGKEKMV